MTTNPWLLEGATKDRQTITPRWVPSAQTLIDGVEVHEVLNVPKSNGYLTEIVRAEWLGNPTIAQVFQVVLEPGALSAWHTHAVTTDRLFVSNGIVRIALYDGREGSPTHGLVNEFRFGTIRPALLVVPPRVWHGVENIGSSHAFVLNLVDRAYDYEDPDHWRVPADSAQIPFRF
ncbi:MAG TPA: dTDP-4-dehydrorhamnose 3,5-epimerase [Thermoanaerobaculia bacterium]|nr:dTDP-4-dehydrorhamnose 3,5-epimerase [Thermoanaerobaculia bacterium]